MKSGDTIFKGDYVVRNDDGYYSVDHNGYAARRRLWGGAVVPGDHRTPNSFSYEVRHERPCSGKVRKIYYTLDPRFNGYYSGFQPGQTQVWSPDWDQRNAVYNMALNRLNDKVRGDLDLGVSLAEFGQTRRMLAAIANVRRYANVSGFGSGRDLANGWLEWQYGWRPLMSDIFDAANEALTLSLSLIKKVSASATIPLTGSGVNTTVIFGGLYWDPRSTGSGKMSCRFVLNLELPGATLDRWSSLNPVSLGWELIPYSFVVDWFYDVGSYLRATETALLYGVRFKNGYVSELYAYDGTDWVPGGTTQKFPSGNPPYNAICDGLIGTIKRRIFSRTALSSYPFPRPPSFRADLGSQQLLSLAALLGQMIK